MTASFFWTRLPSGALRVVGADRRDFVQGQMTADIRSAAVPSAVPGCFLNVRGQIEFFARAYPREQDIYLHLSSSEQAQALAERLRRYIIFDQVEVQDLSAELRTLHLWGGAGLLGLDLRPGEAVTLQEPVTVLLGGVQRSGMPGLDLHYLAQQEPQLTQWLASLGAVEQPEAALEAARVEAGIPDVTRDGFAGSLIPEVGLDLGGPLPSISYRKGCYVGQEIMARLEARGQARYALGRVRTDGALPSHAEVSQGGRVVGQSGAAAGGVALARLRRDLEAGTLVEVAGQPAQVEWPGQ
ncbi:YgfZ/GcvT domain-containing protein [Deinococcus lacus]|uniref:YgfZ/GcvT domain-containing protein n=1 Tax=Deinococcus lacus TaxID=392561 RepID=A0ABW1YC53_9DEIO